MDEAEKLAQFLESFFHTDFYDEAIRMARDYVEDPRRTAEWDELARLVRERRLAEGQPLALVSHRANQALEDNTDDEAYRWLDLMVENVDSQDQIRSY